MQWLAIVIAGLVAAVGSVLGVAAPASAAPAETIYALVNQARAAQGLSGFLRNSSIDAVAASWANQMAANGAMTHNPNFSTQIPAGWSRAGENVAAGYPSAQAVFDGWMNSPGHRANILGDYTDIGIAFISMNGSTWAVQDFGKYSGHAGPPAPPPVPKPKPAPAPVPVAPPPVVPSPAPTPSASQQASASPIPSRTIAPKASAPANARAGSQGDAPAEADSLPALAALVGAAFIGAGFLFTVWRKRRREELAENHAAV